MRLTAETAVTVWFDVAAKAALIATAGWLAAGLLRRRQAALRHAVWAVVLGAVLGLPILRAVCPGWDVPVAVGRSDEPRTTGRASAPTPAGAMMAGSLPVAAAPVPSPARLLPSSVICGRAVTV